MKISKQEIRLVIISSIILLTFIFLNDGFIIHPDSKEYTNTLEFFAKGEDHSSVSKEVTLIRPLMFYLALPFYFIFGDPIIAISILNTFFYLSSIILLYRYVLFFFEDEKIAFWSSLYFSSCFPVIYWGLSVLMEMGTWFFIILSLYCLRNFSIKNIQKKDYKKLLLIGTSLLYKPTLAIIPLFIFFSTLFKFKIRQFPIRHFFVVSMIISLPILVNQIYVWHFFSADYYNDFLKRVLFIWDKSPVSVEAVESQEEYTFKYTQTYRMLTFLIAFPLMIPFFFLGLFSVKKEKEELYLYSLIFIFSSLIIILGFSSTTEYIGAGSPRYAFILFPIFIPITLIGLNKFIGNLGSHSDFFNKYKIQLSNIVVLFYLFFSLVISIFDTEVRISLGLWT